MNVQALFALNLCIWHNHLVQSPCHVTTCTCRDLTVTVADAHTVTSVCCCCRCCPGAKPEAVQQDFIDKWWPDKGAADKPSKPRSCSLVEVLLYVGWDVAGVADLHLGTSWLHETVR